MNFELNQNRNTLASDQIHALLVQYNADQRERLLIYWQRFSESLIEQSQDLHCQDEFLRQLLNVWLSSEFVADYCIRYPHHFLALKFSGDLNRRYSAHEYSLLVHAMLQPSDDEQQLMSKLRQIRQRELVRIAWRDLLGWSDLDENLRDLSDLAGALLEQSFRIIQRLNELEFGYPYTESGQPVQAVVLGMGKLGACELNFSSDVDLIFCYQASGQTQGGQYKIDNHAYFEKLFKQFNRVIDSRTEEGFVYRVDTRLRPFGESGALVSSFAAMEDYYESYGRDWERYAFIKARPVAGDLPAGYQLLDSLRPFVYRRYLDYSAFEALRQMKQLISSEVARKGLHNNIKLGAGGIREIEFIGQMFQLVRGGRVVEYRVQPIQLVLRLLERDGYLSAEATDQILQAYVFLRRTEHRLQMWRDQQCHQLPDEQWHQCVLALSMGFLSWEAFYLHLAGLRQSVSRHFESLVFMTGGSGTDLVQSDRFGEIWSLLEGEDSAALCVRLAELGFQNPPQGYHALVQGRDSFWYRSLSEVARLRVDSIMVSILSQLQGQSRPDEILFRILSLFDAISGRSVYFALLYEHPQALKQLLELISKSQWITDTLAQQPILLDELLDQRSLFHPLDKVQLKRDLNARLEAVAAQDLEQQIEVLHQFKHTHSLRVAATDVLGHRALMQVSDYLTAIAETVLEKVFQLAWGELTEKYGRPSLPSSMETGFAIIAYGKLGGLELSYSSDLDLVFLHAGLEDGCTDGDRTIENSIFYTRLARRMVHFLQIRTLSGVLYEVDLRLRPQGKAGFLVSSLAVFEHYQQEDAWIWEHQALVRARSVVGDEAMCHWFEKHRMQILSRSRDVKALAQEVVNMRDKMRQNLGQEPGTQLKHGVGGLVDIEFIVQFLVLAHGYTTPELTKYTDNVRILEAIGHAHLLTRSEELLLKETYLQLREQMHRSALGVHKEASEGEILAQSRSRVEKIWHNLLLCADK